MILIACLPLRVEVRKYSLITFDVFLKIRSISNNGTLLNRVIKVERRISQDLDL